MAWFGKLNEFAPAGFCTPGPALPAYLLERGEPSAEAVDGKAKGSSHRQLLLTGRDALNAAAIHASVHRPHQMTKWSMHMMTIRLESRPSCMYGLCGERVARQVQLVIV